MTVCALGFAAELLEDGIASNALWPRTLIATAAVQNLLGGDEAMAAPRKPQLYADAAYAVITRPSHERTGDTFLCEDVLAEEGVTDFDVYAYVPGATPQVDLFVDHVSSDADALFSPGDVPVRAGIADPSSLVCPWRRLLQRPHTSPSETIHIDHQPTVAQDFRSERNPAPRGAHAGNR
jgi:hypothetical protein